jgi:Fe-S-cluster containining protein
MAEKPSQDHPAVETLHRDLDRLVKRLVEKHAGRLRCGSGCSMCCVDGVTVFEVEAKNIRHHYPDLLGSGAAHPEGACAFLDENGRCRIYEHRPYVCRTQGLPLRWIEEREDGEVVELRDICTKNEAGTPIEELGADACWTIGPFEERLAELQLKMFGKMERKALRELFRSKK